MKESKMIGIVTWIIAAGLAWLVFFVLVPIVIKLIPATPWTPWKELIAMGIYLATYILTINSFERIIVRGWLEFNGTMDEIRLRKKFHL